MKWKKIASLLIVAIFVFSALAVLANPARAQDEGEYPDTIRIEVRTQQSVGLGDTAQGNLDAFLQTVEGKTYEGISDEWKSQLGTLTSIGAYNSMYYNSANTVTPYETEVEGQLQFNPFAIREIRYAQNFLINREKIVEDLYSGYGVPRYLALGTNSPGYDQYFAPIIDDHEITATGDEDRAIQMITDAMEEARDDPDLEGELRRPSDGFWEYRPPGGDWSDIRPITIIRIEDTRLQIGHYQCDQLEKAGIRPERREMDRSAYGSIVWSTDPADQQWHIYTGGWLASSAVKYQHWAMSQMYSGWYGFAPGGFVPQADYRYSNETIDSLGIRLTNGYINDLDQYWGMMQEQAEAGLEEAIRVFVCSTVDYYPYNKDAVKQVAVDVVTGWSDVFSPRTLKTAESDFIAAQYSSQGSLYMDNWNIIGGSSDVYGLVQQRMTKDFMTYLNPSSGTYIPMRGDFEVNTDYEWSQNETGEWKLNKSLSIPDSGVVDFNPETQEWEEVSDLEVASAVTYDTNLGAWHDGRDFKEQDIMAWYAYSKDLTFENDVENDRFHTGWSSQQTSFFNQIKGIEWGEEDGVFTVYGDYTFPGEDQIAGYYSFFPEIPWQLYEAAEQLIHGTDLAEGLEEYSYDQVEGKNWIHWVSTSQADEFDEVLGNMKDADYVPSYLSSDNNAPLPTTASDVADSIDSLQQFHDDYGHYWVSQGPFKITLHDPGNMVIEMERFDEGDGYPFPNNYWTQRLSVAEMVLSTLTAPGRGTIGEPISVSIGANVEEQFPDQVTRDLQADDDYTVTVQLMSGGNVEYETEATLEGGSLVAEIPGSATEGLEEGSYTLRVRGELADQVSPSTRSKSILLSAGGVTPGELSVSNFETTKDGNTVTVTATVENTGTEDIQVNVMVDGTTEESETLAAGESKDLEYEFDFTDDPGDHTIRIGDQTKTVTIEEEQPGFTFVLLGIAAIAAVLLYRRKNY